MASLSETSTENEDVLNKHSNFRSEDQRFTTPSITNSSSGIHIMNDLLSLLENLNCKTHFQIEQKFSIFFWDLMYNTKLASSDLRSCQEFRESLLQWGTISPQLLGSSNDAWKMDCVMLMNETDKQISSWEKQTEAAIMR